MEERGSNQVKNARHLLNDEFFWINNLDHLHCIVTQQHWFVDLKEVAEHWRDEPESYPFDQNQILDRKLITWNQLKSIKSIK